MEEGTGTTVYDCTGHGFDGVFYDGYSMPEWVPGLSGWGLRFLDTAIVWQIDSTLDDQVTTGLTIAAWVKWQGASWSSCVIFDGRGDYSGTWLGITTVDRQLRFNSYSGQGSQSVLCAGPCYDRWTHVVAVFDETAQLMSLYKDGQLAGTGPITFSYVHSAHPAAIGNNHWAPGDGNWRPFGGVLDEVRFYDYALSAEEVAQLYAEHAAVGDMNCDGVLNFDDIDPFVLALTSPNTYEQQYPQCDLWHGDVNGDCSDDYDDIDPFVWILSGGSQ
jgi:hypothetical protein